MSHILRNGVITVPFAKSVSQNNALTALHRDGADEGVHIQQPFIAECEQSKIV
jgi:hypothetical protein